MIAHKKPATRTGAERASGALPPATLTGQQERQLVVFRLGLESYGVDINTVREIIRVQRTTRVPGASHVVEGVTNLRGRIIPVVDLHRVLGLPASEATPDTRIVVVEGEGQDVGVVVDSVTEVLRVPVESVEPPSGVLDGTDAARFVGIINLGDRLVILVDVLGMLADWLDEARSAVAIVEGNAVTSPERGDGR